MPNFKVVISDPKTRKAYQKEIDQSQSGLVGRKVGDKVSGNPIGLQGYELEITGGSDRQGFPIRPDVGGTVRKRVLLTFPPGFHPGMKGQRKRKSVRGNTISTQIAQINTKVTKYGPKSLEELIGAKPKEKKPITEFLKMQGRFGHLFKWRDDIPIKEFQEEVDFIWNRLLKRAEAE